MNEGGNRRGLVFAALVVMLAAVGIYLTMGSGSGDEQQDSAEPAGVGRTVLGSQEQVSAGGRARRRRPATHPSTSTPTCR